MKKLQISFTGIGSSYKNLELDVKKIKTDQRKANENAESSAINDAQDKMAEMAASGSGIDP
tara:strand:- start:1071 stop:1253 length:183 start_codon:yes stop_codon:yes gene_type:complete